jgi:two-component system chemotaxis response regulator CheY
MTQSPARGIILGDDDLLMRGIVSSILRNIGQKVFPASDGLEVVSLARQFQAHLVLLDIKMPRLNGLQTYQAIRAIPAYAKVPIVMLTAYTDNRMRAAAEKLGVNGYISKPFRPDDLLMVLAPFLELPENGRPAAARPKVQPDTLASRSQVWTSRDDPKPVPNTDPKFTQGREMLRIVRAAERPL